MDAGAPAPKNEVSAPSVYVLSDSETSVPISVIAAGFPAGGPLVEASFKSEAQVGPFVASLASIYKHMDELMSELASIREVLVRNKEILNSLMKDAEDHASLSRLESHLAAVHEHIDDLQVDVAVLQSSLVLLEERMESIFRTSLDTGRNVHALKHRQKLRRRQRQEPPRPEFISN